VRASREAFVETRAREEVRRRRFTVEEYHRMGEVGILRVDECVELIEGEIVEMNPIRSRHAACVRALTHLRSPPEPNPPNRRGSRRRLSAGDDWA
jgi:hypothetical protein